MTVSEFREDMADLSRELHERGVKEFYLISGTSLISKYSTPDELRGEFEEFHSGGE